MTDPSNSKRRVILNLETSDIDDVLMFLFAATHPAIQVVAVTVFPGSKLQIGFLRSCLLDPLGLDIPVGSFDIKHPKDSLDPKHYGKYFGSFKHSAEAEPGAEVMLRLCNSDTTFVSGAALSCLRLAVQRATAEGRDFTIGRLFVQGGFAGRNMVPPELIAPNLLEAADKDMVGGIHVKGSFNFNGDRGAALLLQQHPGLLETRLVAKNVCHRVFWDQEVHSRVAAVKDRNPGLARIWNIMDSYVRDGNLTKKIHDLLCICCAIDPQIGVWEPVHIVSRNGKWGSVPAHDSRVSIITDYDRNRFLEVLTAI